MDIELNDIGSGYDSVFLKKYSLRFGRMRTVGFAKDDDWKEMHD